MKKLQKELKKENGILEKERKKTEKALKKITKLSAKQSSQNGQTEAEDKSTLTTMTALPSKGNSSSLPLVTPQSFFSRRTSHMNVMLELEGFKAPAPRSRPILVRRNSNLW